MLPRADWEGEARALAPGGRARVKHNCGPGAPLLISQDMDGTVRAHCFRCDEHGYAPAPQLSVKEQIERLTRQRCADAMAQMARELPAGTRNVSDWPDGAALWLFKAGLGRPLIGRLGAFWAPSMDRVVLPVKNGPEVVFWQARAWQKDRVPKYLAPDVPRGSVVPIYGHAEDVTITEDILSAFKVGLVGEGWSAMGVSLTDGMLVKLLDRRPRRVNVWLDSDVPGARGASGMCKQLRAVGLTVKNIATRLDPKMYSREQIKEYLQC